MPKRLICFGTRTWLHSSAVRHVLGDPRNSATVSVEIEMALGHFACRPGDVCLVQFDSNSKNEACVRQAFLERTPLGWPRWVAVVPEVSERLVGTCLELNAWAIIKQNASGNIYRQAVNDVCRGRLAYPLQYVDRITTRHGHMSLVPTAGMRLESMTHDERELLKRLATGQAVDHIAKAMNLSRTVIRRRKSELMKRIAANNLAGIVKFAVSAHLLDD